MWLKAAILSILIPLAEANGKSKVQFVKHTGKLAYLW
jgi:hypothetical protein